MDWDKMSVPWLTNADYMEAAHAEVQAALFAAAALRDGERVLDLGFGPGATLPVARAAVGATGHVTGVDIAPPFIAHAKARVGPDIALVTADAATHAFDPASFDAIIANFGIMFFSDTRAALANLRRATRPGGRMAATFWAGPMDNPWFGLPRRVLVGHVPDLPKPDPAGPGPMRFADPSGVLADFAAAGWTAEVETCDLFITPPGTPGDVADTLMGITVAMMLGEVETDDALRAAIRSDLAAGFAEMVAEDGAVKVPARIHVLTATAA